MCSVFKHLFRRKNRAHKLYRIQWIFLAEKVYFDSVSKSLFQRVLKYLSGGKRGHGTNRSWRQKRHEEGKKNLDRESRVEDTWVDPPKDLETSLFGTLKRIFLLFHISSMIKDCLLPAVKLLVQELSFFYLILSFNRLVESFIQLINKR